MNSERKKVFVAISGGVDSSTAAALLLEKGLDCTGVFMITSEHAHHARRQAEESASKLGIKLHVLDLRKDFERILDYFCSEYKSGRTPNPCVCCNRYIKFGRLLEFARANGAKFLATGHYARIMKHTNVTGLYAAADSGKDQSYVLSMIAGDILPQVILPMGDYSKEQTREMAAKLGLEMEGRRESQEICFIPDNDYIGLLERRCPELIRKGSIVDTAGNILGEHNGVHRFTIGQRRGLGVAMGKPYYVAKIDAGTNTVTLGVKEEIMQRRLTAGRANWLVERPESAFRSKVKIRYNSAGAWAKVRAQGSDVSVEFDEAVSAISPGQLAVFYVEEKGYERVVGAGWINKATD